MLPELPTVSQDNARAEKEIESYHRAARKIFKSASGLKVLKMWKELYLDESALIPNDPVSTAYMLGRKELVQEVMGHIKDQDVLDEVNIVTE